MKQFELGVKNQIKIPVKSLEPERERGTNGGDSPRQLIYIGFVRKYYPRS
jgi:hypothetical protein